MPTAPEWLVTWPDIWGGVGGILVIVGLVWAVRRFVHPVMVRIGLVTDLILGRPAQQGIPGQPSMVERIDAVAVDVAEVKAEVAEVKAEVRPNHGGSSHDKIIARVNAVDSRVDRLTQVLGQVYGIQIDPPLDSGTPGV